MVLTISASTSIISAFIFIFYHPSLIASELSSCFYQKVHALESVHAERNGQREDISELDHTCMINSRQNMKLIC